MFFSHMSLFFPDSCAYHFQLPEHQFTRSKSHSKMFCAWFFGRTWNICGKLLKAASSLNSTVTSDIIAGIGSGHTLEQSYGQLNTPQRGRCWRKVTHSHRNIKMYPPLHLHSRTQSLSAWFLDSGSRSRYKFDLGRGYRGWPVSDGRNFDAGHK